MFLTASQLHLSLMLGLLHGQSHCFLAGLLVGCLLTALPGLFGLIVESLLLWLAGTLVALAMRRRPALSKCIDTQDLSDSVILPVWPALAPAFIPVILPV